MFCVCFLCSVVRFSLYGGVTRLGRSLEYVINSYLVTTNAVHRAVTLAKQSVQTEVDIQFPPAPQWRAAGTI